MITDRSIYTSGRLTARPNNTINKEDHKPGIQNIGLDRKKDGFLYIPNSYIKNQPATLAVMLHGAGGNANHGLSLIKQYADENNIILMAPASHASTWDIIAYDGFGPDVLYLNQALELIFERFNIDSNKIAIGGFSDGASYALCLGLSNGDLFTHILAFSPGFSYTVTKKGKPEVFISHGSDDRVLPINSCSRRLVPQLKQQGYQVNYMEFNGEHIIPDGISKSAVDWFKTSSK